MKVLFIKNRNHLYLFSILIGISLILMSIFLIYNSPSYAVEFAKNSFFNIDVTISLNDIEKSDEKKAYLTFDDGPTTKATGNILDILKEENVAMMCAYMLLHFLKSEGDPLGFVEMQDKR